MKNRNDKGAEKGKGSRGEKERRGKMSKSNAKSHLVLCLKPLVKAEEDIFGKTVSLPVSCSLDEKRICSQAVKEGTSSSPEAMATLAA